MDLLVSTPLQLLYINPSSGSSETLRSGDGYYFGITAKENTIVLTHSLGYLQFFKSRSKTFKTIDHLFEPHQIEWIDDKILAANTGRNCVSVFSDTGQWVRDIYFNDIRSDNKDGDRSGNHFNSVHRFENKIFILAHNNGRPSEIWELAWPELEIIGVKPSNAFWAHNIWVGERGFVICDSKEGSLYELNSQQTIWEQPGDQKSLTRGLCVSDEYIFVGYSQHSDRKDRYWNNGGIWVLDRKNLQTLDSIPLPGAGQIYDIRLVNAPDECHNGHIINSEMISRIRRVNPIMEFAYKARQKNPILQRNLNGLSQLLRTRQILTGWKRSLVFEGDAKS
jgi:hypothetical protein